jgi:heme-degrading monooxygenase HmoA
MGATVIAATPDPPYWAVIFTTRQTADVDGYAEMAAAMEALAAQQPGYLGIESVHDGADGITVSYWSTEDDLRAWGRHAEHLVAQRLGRQRWYERYELRVGRVERTTSLPRDRHL